MNSIKRGVYRFADLVAVSGMVGGTQENVDLNFSFHVVNDDGQEVTLYCDWISVDDYGVEYRVASTVPDIDIEEGTNTQYVYTVNDGWRLEGSETITVLEEQFVSEEFAVWFSNHVVMTHMPGKTGVTIEWDGSTDGRLHFPYPLDPDNIVLCQVSDRAFTPRELSEWAYWFDNREHYTASWSTYEKWDRMSTDIYNEHLCYLKDLCVVTSDFSLGGMTIPAGVYFPLVYKEDGDVRYVRRLILQNANEVDPKVIKAGVYQLNEEPVIPSADVFVRFQYTVCLKHWESGPDIEPGVVEAEDNGYAIVVTVTEGREGYNLVYYTDRQDAYVYRTTEGWSAFHGEKARLITVPFDQEVSGGEHEWFTANTKRVAAMVSYNDANIAVLGGGQRATLKCAGMTMESDVVVTASEAQERVPVYSGAWEVTQW